jgi:hypothetical protein
MSKHDYHCPRLSGLLPAPDGWRPVWIEREHVHSVPIVGWWVDTNHWTEPVLAHGATNIDNFTDDHCLIVDPRGYCWRWTLNIADGVCEWETLDAALATIRAEPALRPILVRARTTVSTCRPDNTATPP